MKRLLASGCAGICLVAAGGSLAQSPGKFAVTLGGDAFVEGAFVSQDRDAGLRSTEIRNRYRLVVTSTGTADNGLEYGARVRLRANNADRSVDADRAFLFAQGAFGTVRAGVINPYSDDILALMQGPLDYRVLAIIDPAVAFAGAGSVGGLPTAQTITPAGVQGPDIGSLYGGHSSLSYRHSMLPGIATKLVYYSPRFAGFQFAGSYTPRTDSANTDVTRTKTNAVGATGVQGTFTDVIEAALSYQQVFGDLTVKAFAEVQTGQSLDSTANAAGFKDMRVWHAGGQIGYGAFSLGGAYLDLGQSGQSKAAAARRENGNLWHLAAQYRSGPLAVGLGYQRGKDAGSLAVAGARKLDIYDIGVMYTVAPGLSIGAEYDYFKSKSDQSTAALDRDDKGSAVILRSVLTF